MTSHIGKSLPKGENRRDVSNHHLGFSHRLVKRQANLEVLDGGRDLEFDLNKPMETQCNYRSRHKFPSYHSNLECLSHFHLGWALLDIGRYITNPSLISSSIHPRPSAGFAQGRAESRGNAPQWETWRISRSSWWLMAMMKDVKCKFVDLAK